jgi:hypothetical protein
MNRSGTKLGTKKDRKKPISVGSRQAVEAAIDAAKGSSTQTWESAARKSDIPLWKKENADACNGDDRE